MVAASPALLRRHETPRHPRELAQASCVHTMGADRSTWQFREGSKTFGVAVRGPLVSNLVAPVLQACVQGLGFGRFLSYQVQPCVRDKQSCRRERGSSSRQ